MRYKHFFFIPFVLPVLPVLLFLSCASAPKLNRVYVTNTNRVDLLPVEAISREIDEYQYFEGSFGEKSFSALLYLQTDKDSINILLLNEFGIEAGSVYYDGESARFESEFFPKNPKCEYIILDLQNAYADFKALKTHYEKYNLVFEEAIEDSADTEKYVRFIKDKKGRIIEEIVKEPGRITITNRLRNYRYILSSAGAD